MPFKKGHVPWHKGRKGLYHISEETKRKLSELRKELKILFLGSTTPQKQGGNCPNCARVNTIQNCLWQERVNTIQNCQKRSRASTPPKKQGENCLKRARIPPKRREEKYRKRSKANPTQRLGSRANHVPKKYGEKYLNRRGVDSSQKDINKNCQLRTSTP